MPSSRTSSSRPTPGRGYQTLPHSAGAQNEPRQDDAPDWASGPFTLYISYLHAHVPEKMLFSVLRQTGLGMMRRQGAIELTKHDAKDGGYPFQSAKIHFDFLFTRGEQREQNLQVLDHLLHGGDDAHFQVVYQAARRNPKTGIDEPDRFWKIKAWREGQRSASPSESPSLKISLHGGAVGPKDVAKTTKPSAQVLARAAAKRHAKEARLAPDSDGFQQPKTRGGSGAVAAGDTAGIGSARNVGGGFAALAESPSASESGESTSPKPMTKSAKKNARRAQARAERATAAASVSDEVAGVLAQRSEEQEGRQPELANYPPTPMTQAEMDEVDTEIAAAEAAHLPTPTNAEMADQAAEFIMENQICEEGAENCSAWEMDAATGTMIYHDEMTADQAASIVPPHEVLDVEGLHEAIDIAENGCPTAQRAPGGLSDE